jgi:hypothetical protein
MCEYSTNAELALQYVVPTALTTYHCKVYRVPTRFTTRRHAIAVSTADVQELGYFLHCEFIFQHKTIIDSSNRDIVHHLLMYECNPTAIFDDNNLPSGLCDNLQNVAKLCLSNIATGWAMGGDDVSNS